MTATTLTRGPSRHRSNPVRISALTNALLMRALFDGPSTMADMVAATGLAPSTIRRYLTALRRERITCITGWETDKLGRASVPAYGIGERDAKRPPRQCATRRSRQYNQRCRQLAALRAIAGAAAK